jgi:hypothetical protein
MTEETQNATEYTNKLVDALIELIQSNASPEMIQARQMLTRRLALTGDIIPSRIPAPRNITEIGGYFNLMETLQQEELRGQVLASLLGVAGPVPESLSLISPGPVLFFAGRKNDRPDGPAQPSIKTQFFVRSDFAVDIDQVLNTIHAHGCQLPLHSSQPHLPGLGVNAANEVDMLKYIGRVLEFAPSAALLDPDLDALAVARLDAGGDLQVVARQIDGGAPLAGGVSTESWVAIQCDQANCQETTDDRSYLPLTPIMNSAGWYQESLTAPVSLAEPGSWNRWTNVTGLVAGVTTYSEELFLLHTPAEIAASALRDRLNWIWDGSEFASPE